jgi:adenosine 3'-phospho 5'-phosphosulfate transporter B2
MTDNNKQRQVRPVVHFIVQDATSHRDTVTTTSGLCLLVGYMLFDSFTSNWQGELFVQYRMSSIQMMAGVNLFSCLLTTVSLVEQGGFISSAGKC